MWFSTNNFDSPLTLSLLPVWLPILSCSLLVTLLATVQFVASMILHEVVDDGRVRARNHCDERKREIEQEREKEYVRGKRDGWEVEGVQGGRARVIGKGGGRQVRGCSIFIGERRRNDFKCLQKLPRHRRFLIICIISIALIAAALIICRFMFSSEHRRRRRRRRRLLQQRVTSPASTHSLWRDAKIVIELFIAF